MIRTQTTPIAEITEIERGLIHVSMFNGEYTLDQCVEHMEILKEDFRGEQEPLRMMVTMKSTRGGASKKIRDYFARPENSKINKANAYIVKSSIAKIGINLFLKFNKPPYPTKNFKNEEEALAWLRTI